MDLQSSPWDRLYFFLSLGAKNLTRNPIRNLLSGIVIAFCATAYLSMDSILSWIGRRRCGTSSSSRPATRGSGPGIWPHL